MQSARGGALSLSISRHLTLSPPCSPSVSPSLAPAFSPLSPPTLITDGDPNTREEACEFASLDSSSVCVERSVFVPRLLPKCGSTIEDPWEFWKSIGSPRYVVAPMVDQSHIAFRLLCRRYGAELTYTPMINSGMFSTIETSESRRNFFSSSSADWPCFAQFCGDDPHTIISAAQLISGDDSIAAIDLNLGCPQRIAARGHYGAYLMEDWNLIHDILTTMCREISIPVTAKIRVFDDLQQSVDYARMVASTGIKVLAVHGRTREQRGPKSGRADWEKIRAIREAIDIPLIANGNIKHMKDVDHCLLETGADAVMSAMTILRNPRLFSGQDIGDYDCLDIANEYVDIAIEHETSPSYVKQHLFEILYDLVPLYPAWREKLAAWRVDIQEYRTLLAELRSLREIHPNGTRDGSEMDHMAKEIERKREERRKKRESQSDSDPSDSSDK